MKLKGFHGPVSFYFLKYLQMEEEWKSEGITEVMFLRMITLSNGKVFNRKASFNRQTFRFSVLPCQWIAKQQQVTSRYKPRMYSTHKDVKSQGQVKTIYSATPYDWGWGISSLGFKRTGDLIADLSTNKVVAFSKTAYQYEWFHLGFAHIYDRHCYTLVNSASTTFLMAEGTQASLLISLLSPLAQTTLNACSLHLQVWFLMGKVPHSMNLSQSFSWYIFWLKAFKHSVSSMKHNNWERNILQLYNDTSHTKLSRKFWLACSCHGDRVPHCEEWLYINAPLLQYTAYLQKILYSSSITKAFQMTTVGYCT